MAGDADRMSDNLIQETTRVSRIRLDAANAGNTGKTKKPNGGHAA